MAEEQTRPLGWTDQHGHNRAQVIYEAMLRSIGDGVVATDDQGMIIFMNRAAEEMLHWKSEDIEGKHLVEVSVLSDAQGEHVSTDRHPMSLALQTGEHQATNDYYFIRRMPGEEPRLFPVYIAAAPVYIGKEVIGAIEVFRDITQEKEIDRLKDEFLSIAAHELRTPMTAIMGNVDMVLHGDAGAVSDEAKEYLQDVAKATDRLIALVNDILNASRIEAGRMKFRPQPAVDLVDLIKQQVRVFEPLAKQKGLQVTLQPAPQLPQVFADPDKVQQVLSNIIGNAVKYTLQGSVTVSTEVRGDLVVVHVRDTGVGIRETEKSKLFQKFSKLDLTASLPVDSTGLGLYITRQIVDHLGGSIWADSEGEGKGSVFSFSLPVAGSALAKQTADQLAADAAASTDQK